MPIYRRADDPENKEVAPKAKEPEEETVQKVSAGSFKNFMNSPQTKAFIEEWHKNGYTKAGVEELLFELHARYGGDDDDDDSADAVRKRAGEMLEVMKSVRGLFEPFKTD